MSIMDRIKDAIENYRQATGREPMRVVLSQRAFNKFVTENIPRNIGDDVDPEGSEACAFGIPVRILSDEPGEFVGVVASSERE